MGHYRLESEWKLTAPNDAVFDLLSHPEDFQDWWPSVKRSRLLGHGDDSGVGARAEYTVRGPFLYSMTFTATSVEIDKPNRIHTLIRGELVGTGTYDIDVADGTNVRLVWRVSTTKPWMKRLSPLMRPVFVWAHRSVMRKGATAMANQLGAQLLSTGTVLVEDSHARRNLSVAS